MSGVPQKINPNIPSKAKSFQRLQNEEVTELKNREKNFKKKNLKILVN